LPKTSSSCASKHTQQQQQQQQQQEEQQPTEQIQLQIKFTVEHVSTTTHQGTKES